MTSSKDFDYFLKNGFLEGLNPGSSMSILLNCFGDNCWYTKEIENNGLVYGIIKVGFIEFHIYNEQLTGISYRPDLPFNKKDFDTQELPWIYKRRNLSSIEGNLRARQINFTKYTINGPLASFKTAGTDLFGLEDSEYTFVDTEGGVTFLFEAAKHTIDIEACQICKYYNI